MNGAPGRFRLRLTAAFVLVAAISAGLLAVLAFTLAREYRWHNVRQQATEEARVALVLAPADLNAERFERLRDEYETRSEADILAVGPSGTFTSSPDIGLDDVPASLHRPGTDPHPVSADVRGRPFLVVGGDGADNTRYWFFFSLTQLEESLDELARASAVAWVITVVLAGAIGRSVARRTLRPVAAAAAAAEAVAAGQRSMRLPTGNDEFGMLASSFNRMADEVQRTIDELERAAERERRFTADVAHDLRTPLTGMAASASLLADQVEQLPATARRPAALLVADVARLRSLVLDLLELSRLDSKLDEVRLERLNVARAVDAARRSLGSNVSLDLDVHVDDDADVLAEPRRLGRILANLLANAAVHGGGSASLRAWRANDTIRIEIADTGPGIPAVELATVFDRFAKSDRSRASGGSGLGLAIAKAHALAQGGDVLADNPTEGGARFTIVLPAAASDSTPPTAPATRRAGATDEHRHAASQTVTRA